jgi:hypothetical protein
MKKLLYLFLLALIVVLAPKTYAQSDRQVWTDPSTGHTMTCDRPVNDPSLCLNVRRCPDCVLATKQVIVIESRQEPRYAPRPQRVYVEPTYQTETRDYSRTDWGISYGGYNNGYGNYNNGYYNNGYGANNPFGDWTGVYNGPGYNSGYNNNYGNGRYNNGNRRQTYQYRPRMRIQIPSGYINHTHERVQVRRTVY